MTTQAKPSDTFRWANVGGSIVVPPSGKKDVGHVTAERPPAQYENYLKNGAYQWHNFVDAFFSNGGNGNGLAIGHTDLGNDAEATVTPIALHRDYVGNARSLVDHNGYRMGEVSELDEAWQSAPVTIQVPMGNFQSVGGTWSFTSNFWQNTASGTLSCSLSDLVPPNAVITSIVWSFNKSTAGDTIGFDYQTYLNGTGTSRVFKSINTGTGNATTDQMVSPTSGQGPQQIGFGGVPAAACDDTVLQVSTTETTTIKLFGCRITYVIPSPNWTYSQATLGASASGDAVSLVDPQSGLNQRGVRLVGAAISANAGNSVLAGPWDAWLDDNLAYVAEFMVKTGTITDGSAHRLFRLGVQHNHAGALDWFAALYSDATFANWQLQVVDGAGTTNTDSGVAIAASTVYRVRIEIFGGSTSSAGAGHARIRLFLNGAKVADVTSNTFTADKIRSYFKVATSSATGGPYDVTIGRVRRCWNHLLAGDNL
jgi:hypothetical protein